MDQQNELAVELPPLRLLYSIEVSHGLIRRVSGFSVMGVITMNA